MPLRCSIIVPTFKRPQALKECLASLKNLNGGPYEIVVIENLGKSEARNAGAAKATGDILLFIDDDCTADPAWAHTLITALEQDNADFAFGKTIYVHEGYVGRFPEKVNQNFGSWPGAGNIAYRREVFEKAGGFDPAFDRYNNEDTEMAIRAVSEGFRFSGVPQAIVYHQKSYWTAETLRKSIKNSFVWPILKKKYPMHYATFGLPPNHYLWQSARMFARWIIFLFCKNILW